MSTSPVRDLRNLLDRVRSRWRRLLVLQAIVRAALSAAAVLSVAFLVSGWISSLTLLTVVGVLGFAGAIAALVWGVKPARENPSDSRVARYVEERYPALDDRLVSAVGLLAIDEASRPTLAPAMLEDAGRAMAAIDAASIIHDDRLRRAVLQATAAVLVLGAVLFVGKERARRSFDAMAIALFPSRVTLEVVPDTVAVAHPPRVTRVDLEYRYPAQLGLAARTEEDGGDIYAPAGTEVRMRIHTDPPSATGRLTFADGATGPLAAGVDGNGKPALTGTLKVAGDSSYRIALVDAEGLRNPGGTEYFIRILNDRPPDVHVRKPARDRSVTMLEEVEIEADAEDDFGIDRLELVYAVRGSEEKVVPFHITPDQTAVSGARTLYLEDLDVAPGDFVSYYVRARDRGRGRRSSEGRSDIFFLQVRPFEQEFVLARSQSTGGTTGDRTLDDLVTAQKEVIVATWKLDRRSQAADGARSADDIRAVAKSEEDLKKRAEAASSAFRENNMRDPRQRQPQPGRGQATPARAGQLRPEENAMTAAARAMGEAVASLNKLRTAESVPSEMEALNHLLMAQSDLRRQEVARQQAGNAAGNRGAQDLSSLFDRELQREQQTNYETQPAAARNEASNLADRVKELAQRQDEINQQQKQAERLSVEERRRALDRLAREQNELRQQAEQLAGQLDQQGSRGSRGSQGSQGSQSSQSSQSSQGSQNSARMRAATEEMRNAAGGLQRQDARQASERGARAADRLRDLERQLRSGSPEEQRRALGEMQLEARQLADAERQLASDLRGAGTQGSAQGSNDALRRLAGEQERLADRARKVQESLGQQAAAIAGAPSGNNADLQRAVGAAANDLNRQRLPERMTQTADEIRAAAGQSGDKASDNRTEKAASAQEAVARELDSLADKLQTAETPRDDASKRMADQRARAQDLRDEINRLTSEMARMGSGTGGVDVDRLRQEYANRLREARQLLDELRRDDPSLTQGGPGLTFEGQGMTLSAPGTEAFKQDFAKWDQLRQQATMLLSQAESSLSQRLQARAAQDHLAAGASDRAPSSYQRQVDDYFKAIAQGKP